MSNGYGKPSQAEGDRETVEEALRRRESDLATGRTGESRSARLPRTDDPAEVYSLDKPSQAEGDRETIEEDLRRPRA